MDRLRVAVTVPSVSVFVSQWMTIQWLFFSFAPRCNPHKNTNQLYKGMNFLWPLLLLGHCDGHHIFLQSTKSILVTVGLTLAFCDSAKRRTALTMISSSSVMAGRKRQSSTIHRGTDEPVFRRTSETEEQLSCAKGILHINGFTYLCPLLIQSLSFYWVIYGIIYCYCYIPLLG